MHNKVMEKGCFIIATLCECVSVCVCVCVCNFQAGVESAANVCGNTIEVPGKVFGYKV